MHYMHEHTGAGSGRRVLSWPEPLSCHSLSASEAMRSGTEQRAERIGSGLEKTTRKNLRYESRSNGRTEQNHDGSQGDRGSSFFTWPLPSRGQWRRRRALPPGGPKANAVS